MRGIRGQAIYRSIWTIMDLKRADFDSLKNSYKELNIGIRYPTNKYTKVALYHVLAKKIIEPSTMSHWNVIWPSRKQIFPPILNDSYRAGVEILKTLKEEEEGRARLSANMSFASTNSTVSTSLAASAIRRSRKHHWPVYSTTPTPGGYSCRTEEAQTANTMAIGP